MINNKTAIPVLMYHHVNPEGDFINIKPLIFEKQIRFLKRHGFTALHTDELLMILKGQKQSPKKPVMITFDDGWLDNWQFAFPILKKYDMKAVIFVITSLISEGGKRNRFDEGNLVSLPSHEECHRMIEAGRGSEVMLSWDEVREMEASGLIDIQSHTHTHQKWDKLYTDSNKQTEVLSEDLRLSKKIVEERLGKQCKALCWPWGRYNSAYIDMAKSAGYELLFTTEKGTNTVDSDPFKIKRLVIGNMSGLSFRKKMFIHSSGRLSEMYLRYFK